MTSNEADYIIDMINAGGRFSTRFQEESWGFYREQIAARLTLGYSFAVFKERTRFETLVIDGRQYPIGITHFAFPEAGLRNLAFMPNLRQIVLSHESSRFTQAGLAELSAQLPACTILVKGVGEFSGGQFTGTWPE